MPRAALAKLPGLALRLTGGDRKRRPPRGGIPVAIPVLVLLVAAIAGCTGSPPGGRLAGENATGGGTPGGAEPPAPGTTGGATSGGSSTPGAVVHVVFNTSKGDIRLVLYGDKTPVTVNSFLNLTRSGFYDGTRFHRVIKDFMNQGGDPNSKDPAKANQWGTGGPGYTIEDEFPCKDGFTSRKIPHECGTHGGLVDTFNKLGRLAMANTGQSHTGGSQFFITAANTTWLDGKHTIFGDVEGGMDVVLAINRAPTGTGDRPNPEILLSKVTVVG